MRVLRLLLLFALVALTAPACAPERRGILLWHAYRGDEERALQAILATWKGPPVDAVAIPHEAFATKLAAAIPLGDGPDLFIDAHERLGEDRHKKIVAPVGDALEEGAFTAPALAAVRDKGVAWAVPLSMKSLALYANTDLVHEMPADMEAIEALVGHLPAGTFPLAYQAGQAYSFAPLLAAFGGSVVAPDGRFPFVGPEATRAVAFARELVDRHVVPEAADGAMVQRLFSAGQAAFAISGPWLAADLGDTHVHYRVAPLPKVRATGAPMRPLLTVEAVMLSPSGADRAPVRALARHLASAEAARVRERFGPTPSARVDVVSDDPNARAFAAQAADAIPMPSSPAMNAAWDPADRALRKVLRHDAEPEAALEEARARFEDVVRPLPTRASILPLTLAVGALGLIAALRAVRAAKQPGFARELARSRRAYAYVAHAVVALGVLVVLPLAMGAAISLSAGNDDERHYVGLANFIEILTARGGPLFSSGSFYLVLAVTVLWTVCNVALHLAIGVSLAVVLARPTLRLRAMYRVLLIIPWAVPNYVTALAWKGMFDHQFGAVTGLILALDRAFGLDMEPISWFAKFSTAFTANLATNVWLGFPFMMVVTLGALTGVPEDVLEAAKVDGATRWQRLRLVTLPIIRPTLLPAVLLGAIWTFNMFNVVFLVSGGDPDGDTDILVSEAYRWAFTRQNQYGYAAAYAVIIFVMLFGVSRLTGGRRAPVSGA